MEIIYQQWADYADDDDTGECEDSCGLHVDHTGECAPK